MKAPFDLEETEALARQVKRELRRRMRSLRGALSAETRAALSCTVVERLASLDIFEGACVVGLYAPMVEAGELDIEPLHDVLTSRGLRVAYPRVLESGALAFHRVGDRRCLEERGNRFREPPEDPGTEEGALDALVVPALAADPEGNRLGYGGGAFDRTLASFAVRPRTVAVIYDFQVLVEVPRLSTDVPVDLVLTDRRVFRSPT